MLLLAGCSWHAAYGCVGAWCLPPQHPRACVHPHLRDAWPKIAHAHLSFRVFSHINALPPCNKALIFRQGIFHPRIAHRLAKCGRASCCRPSAVSSVTGLGPLGHLSDVVSGARHLLQRRMLKLPCTALHPARTWGSRGTCRWFGCSIRSRRSWSIQRWRSTPGKPAPQTPEHHCHCLHPTHLVPSPCPAIAVGLTLCHEASPKLPLRCWSAATWDGGGHGFQQFGPVKSFSEHRPLCLLSQLLLKYWRLWFLTCYFFFSLVQ